MRVNVSVTIVMSLKGLQQAFAADLRSDGAGHLHGLVHADEISTERRVNVYRNNSRASLRSTLAVVYPVIRKLVGSDFFAYLLDRYTKDYPSRSGNLQDFGRNLSEFLINCEPVSTIPYLVDVARLEWAYQEVSLAASLQPPDLESLKTLAPHSLPDLRFELGSACRLVTSPYPIFSIWKVNQDGYVGDNAVTLEEGSQPVLIVRPKDEVELWRLREAESIFMDTLVSGKTLGAAVEAMTLCGHDFNLETLLAKFVQSGFLVFSSIKRRPNGLQ